MFFCFSLSESVVLITLLIVSNLLYLFNSTFSVCFSSLRFRFVRVNATLVITKNFVFKFFNCATNYCLKIFSKKCLNCRGREIKNKSIVRLCHYVS